MGLRKGQTNNKAGKPAGTLNKMSKELRQQISDFLEENFPKVVQEFSNLKGKDKVKLYTDLLPYSLPRLESISIGEMGLEVFTDEQLDQIINKLKSGYENKENRTERSTD